MEESPEQVLQRLSRQIEELTRSMSEVMSRQNAMDSHLSNLINSENTAAPHANGRGPPGFPDEPPGRSNLIRTTAEVGWKAIRYQKVYLETIPEYDGKASSWSAFMTKLRLTLDQTYEWAPVYLRMSEQLEFSPNRDHLVAWIEHPSVGFDRSDLVEFGKDLWSILCNRVAPGTGPATVIQRVMDAETGWMRGPQALYEIQKEGLGRAADRRAELNRRVHNPSSVRKWEEVPGALNAWETTANEYVSLTKQVLDEETRMNSLLRLLPKSLYELTASQYGISTYGQLRSYILAQCTRAKYGQHGLGSGSSRDPGGVAPHGDRSCET